MYKGLVIISLQTVFNGKNPHFIWYLQKFRWKNKFFHKNFSSKRFEYVFIPSWKVDLYCTLLTRPLLKKIFFYFSFNLHV